MKFFTKSGILAAGQECDPDGIIGVRRSEEPPLIGADEFVVGELELGQKLVAVGLVERPSGIAPVDLVFVIVVESVVFTGSGFRETVGISFFGLVENDELSSVGRLSGFTKISPEARHLDVVAAAIVEIAACLVGDLLLSDLRTWLCPHVSWARYGIGA